jgi:predicted metal-binding protein
MTNLKLVRDLALSCGFTYVGALDPETIVPRIEVRESCATNKCHAYDKNWSCPPGCGTLEECTNIIRQYSTGLILQTFGRLEDHFDFESMDAINMRHRDNIARFADEVRKQYPDALVFGDGCCTRCKECTYPDAPCRFPEKMTSSMEAFGMFVSEVCMKNDLPYYYGENTLTYVGCVLFK